VNHKNNSFAAKIVLEGFDSDLADNLLKEFRPWIPAFSMMISRLKFCSAHSLAKKIRQRARGCALLGNCKKLTQAQPVRKGSKTVLNAK